VLLEREGSPPAVGQAWYAYDGDQERFRESLARLEPYLEGVLGEVSRHAGVDTARLVVIGYSMGAYVGGYFALRRSPLPVGLALLAGRLKHEFLAPELERAHGLPVLFASGKRDRTLPRERLEEGRRALIAHGARVASIEHEGGHGLSGELVAELRYWVDGVLAGA
jgi:phospholipase/carboxylesterase